MSVAEAEARVEAFVAHCFKDNGEKRVRAHPCDHARTCSVRGRGRVGARIGESAFAV